MREGEEALECAACGLPAHRYGRNEGMDRFDPQACINGLLAVIGDLRLAARVYAELEVVFRQNALDIP